jgi:hypothetical protein
MLIALLNASTHFKDRLPTVSLIAQAVNLQMRRHAAPLWGAIPWSCSFFADATQVPPSSYPLVLFDHSDQAGALGYHDQGPDGKPYGKVFVDEVLDGGGTETSGSNSVSVTVSHEGLEIFGDPQVGSWDQMPDGRLTAHELCDAVEGDSYPIEVAPGQSVSVSNFLLPGWFDANPEEQAFDFMRVISRPFAMSPGGYLIVMQGGEVSQVFATHSRAMHSASKLHPASRTARRLRAFSPAR